VFIGKMAHDATQVAAVGDVQTKFDISYHAMIFMETRVRDECNYFGIGSKETVS
jgi:hypothetical protein